LINDTIPERRNLLVLCSITLLFFIGGGDACGELKLPLLGIELTKPSRLAYAYTFIFLYITARYLVVFKNSSYSIEDDSQEVMSSNNWKHALISLLASKRAKFSIDPHRHLWHSKGTQEYLTFSDACASINCTKDDIRAVSRHISKGKNNTHNFHIKMEFEDKNLLITKHISFFSYEFIRSLIIVLFFKFGLFRDRYAFDWIFPWMLWAGTIAVILTNFVSGNYVICSAKP